MHDIGVKRCRLAYRYESQPSVALHWQSLENDGRQCETADTPGQRQTEVPLTLWLTADPRQRLLVEQNHLWCTEW